MEFQETEEFWKLANRFFASTDKERQGGKFYMSETELAELKSMLPNTFTKDNPYQVYLDGEVHCNLWYEGDDIKCGEYYSEGIFPEPEPVVRTETELTILDDWTRVYNVETLPAELAIQIENPNLHFVIEDWWVNGDGETMIILLYSLMYYPNNQNEIVYRVGSEVRLLMYDPNNVFKNDKKGDEIMKMFGETYQKNYSALINKLVESGHYTTDQLEIDIETAIKKSREIIEINNKRVIESGDITSKFTCDQDD